MIIKEHNTNKYVSIHLKDFNSYSHYYQEIMRIQFNRIHNYSDPVDLINTKLNLLDNKKNKK